MSEIDNEKRISELEKQVAVSNVRFEQINQNISEIKNNHILHINDQLLVIGNTINTNNTNLTSLINTKISELYKTLTALKINDAKQEPTNNILTKVIEYIVVGVVGAVLMFVLKK
jgi:uncharacterized coiled-coil protein SlyX